MISLMLVGIGNPFQSVVIRLSSSACEDDLLAPGADKFRHLSPCLFYRPLRFLPIRVDTRRIAKGIGKIGQHGLHYLRISWRGGRMVKIYPFHLLSLHNIINNRVDPCPLCQSP